MKSASFPIVLFIVALLVLADAVKVLFVPFVKHYWAKYQHYKMIENRRKQFYSELKFLMAS